MTKQASIYVASSTEGLPSKYQRLAEASAAGLRTPHTLLLTSPIQAVNEFLAEFPAQTRFIVRSANKTEDGHGHSLAGHFWSSSAVAIEEVPATIQAAWLENERLLANLGLEPSPVLMLQEYIEHTVGGVLFSPWSFFSDFAYLEYADTVQAVVAGQAQAALVNLHAEASPLLLTPSVHFLEPLLKDLALKLRTTFAFPLDCEWAYSSHEQQLVVLQVRAQTHAIGSFLPLPANLAKPEANWKFTAVSESLGKLSPLSFSLLEQLYQDARLALQRLGCKAEQVNFFAYQPDGTVLVDPVLQQAFYQSTWLGGFWKGFRAAEFNAKAEAILANFTAERAFAYTELSQLFNAWLIQNLLQHGQGRESAPPIHAYELSWLNPVDSFEVNAAAPLNLQLRQAFLLELNKLKKTLLSSPEWVFCDWAEYQGQDFSQARQRQQAAAPLAIYDYSLATHDVEFQSLAAASSARGTVLWVKPSSSKLPDLIADTILVAAYFDNRWVQLIPQLKAILVGQGSRLAHSAIVAREYGIPYLVISSAQLAELNSGMQIEVDARSGQIRKL